MNSTYRELKCEKCDRTRLHVPLHSRLYNFLSAILGLRADRIVRWKCQSCQCVRKLKLATNKSSAEKKQSSTADSTTESTEKRKSRRRKPISSAPSSLNLEDPIFDESEQLDSAEVPVAVGASSETQVETLSEPIEPIESIEASSGLGISSTPGVIDSASSSAQPKDQEQDESLELTETSSVPIEDRIFDENEEPVVDDVEDRIFDDDQEQRERERLQQLQAPPERKRKKQRSISRMLLKGIRGGVVGFALSPYWILVFLFRRRDYKFLRFSIFLFAALGIGYGVFVFGKGRFEEYVAETEINDLKSALENAILSDDTEEQEELLKRLRPLEPNEPSHVFLEAQLYWDKGEQSKSIQTVKDFIQLGEETHAPMGMWLGKKLAQIAIDNGFEESDVESITNYLKFGLSFEPNDEEAILLLLKVQSQNNDMAGIEETLSLACEHYPKYYEQLFQYHVSRRNIIGARNAQDRLEAHIDTVLQSEPEDVRANLTKARLLTGKGEYALAAPHYQTALSGEILEEVLRFYVRWAKTLPNKSEEEYLKCKEILERGLEMSPKHIATLNQLAMNYYSCLDKVEMPEVLRVRFENQTATARMYLAQGTSHQMRGDITNAINSFQDAYDRDTGDIELLNNFADALMTRRQGDDLKRSREMIDEAIRLSNGKSPVLILTRGEVAYFQEDWQRCISDLEQVLKAYQDKEKVYLYLSNSYRAIGNDETANRYTQQFLTLRKMFEKE